MQTLGIPQVLLHHRLALAMEHAGVKRSDMASYLGVSGNTISNYTNGHTRVPVSVIRLWAQRCSVPYSWLSTGEIDPEEADGWYMGRCPPTPGQLVLNLVAA